MSGSEYARIMVPGMGSLQHYLSIYVNDSNPLLVHADFPCLVRVEFENMKSPQRLAKEFRFGLDE